MPRRFNPSQFRSELRRLEQKQRQAVNDYNREVRRVNAHNKRVVDDWNRRARAHNQRVRANRRRLANELARLMNKPTIKVRYTTYQASVNTLHQSFLRLENAAEQGVWIGDDMFDIAEAETANSVAVLNALLAEPVEHEVDDPALQQTSITTELSDISLDLDSRWQGALFALNPRNPDAARQFCTSARAILAAILDLKAPDKTVLAANPRAKLTDQGKVQRREKIYYCLTESGQHSYELADFVDDDINNVMELFGVFNPATHGSAGKYDMLQLSAIKTRVEGAIQFLHRIVT
jgi:hypothetical protein